MRIGILGGTGPAGSGLAARLASIGYEVVIGSRSKYRAMESRDSIVEKWPELSERLTYTEIAADLYLSLNTVKTHLRHAYMKLGVTSRSSAVKRATSLGIL